nr:hypothetical protein Iba_chr12bCG24440 [Ipomoea batatas]
MLRLVKNFIKLHRLIIVSVAFVPKSHATNNVVRQRNNSVTRIFRTSRQYSPYGANDVEEQLKLIFVAAYSGGRPEKTRS